MNKLLLIATLMATGAARAQVGDYLEIMPREVVLRPGDTFTFQIVTRVTSGQPVSFQDAMDWDRSRALLAIDFPKTDDPADWVHGRVSTTAGQTRFIKLQVDEAAHDATQTLTVGDYDATHVSSANITVHGGTNGCAAGYTPNPSNPAYCSPGFGCTSTGGGLGALAALPLLFAFRRRR